MNAAERDVTIGSPLPPSATHSAGARALGGEGGGLRGPWPLGGLARDADDGVVQRHRFYLSQVHGYFLIEDRLERLLDRRRQPLQVPGALGRHLLQHRGPAVE